MAAPETTTTTIMESNDLSLLLSGIPRVIAIDPAGGHVFNDGGNESVITCAVSDTNENNGTDARDNTNTPSNNDSTNNNKNDSTTTTGEPISPTVAKRTSSSSKHHRALDNDCKERRCSSNSNHSCNSPTKNNNKRRTRSVSRHRSSSRKHRVNSEERDTTETSKRTQSCSRPSTSEQGGDCSRRAAPSRSKSSKDNEKTDRRIVPPTRSKSSTSATSPITSESKYDTEVANDKSKENEKKTKTSSESSEIERHDNANRGNINTHQREHPDRKRSSSKSKRGERRAPGRSRSSSLSKKHSEQLKATPGRSRSSSLCKRNNSEKRTLPERSRSSSLGKRTVERNHHQSRTRSRSHSRGKRSTHREVNKHGGRSKSRSRAPVRRTRSNSESRNSFKRLVVDKDESDRANNRRVKIKRSKSDSEDNGLYFKFLLTTSNDIRLRLNGSGMMQKSSPDDYSSVKKSSSFSDVSKLENNKSEYSPSLSSTRNGAGNASKRRGKLFQQRRLESSIKTSDIDNATTINEMTEGQTARDLASPVRNTDETISHANNSPNCVLDSLEIYNLLRSPIHSDNATSHCLKSSPNSTKKSPVTQSDKTTTTGHSPKRPPTTNNNKDNDNDNDNEPTTPRTQNLKRQDGFIIRRSKSASDIKKLGTDNSNAAVVDNELHCSLTSIQSHTSSIRRHHFSRNKSLLHCDKRDNNIDRITDGVSPNSHRKRPIRKSRSSSNMHKLKAVVASGSNNESSAGETSMDSLNNTRLITKCRRRETRGRKVIHNVSRNTSRRNRSRSKRSDDSSHSKKRNVESENQEENANESKEHQEVVGTSDHNIITCSETNKETKSEAKDSTFGKSDTESIVDDGKEKDEAILEKDALGNNVANYNNNISATDASFASCAARTIDSSKILSLFSPMTPKRTSSCNSANTSFSSILGGFMTPKCYTNTPKTVATAPMSATTCSTVTNSNSNSLLGGLSLLTPSSTQRSSLPSSSKLIALNNYSVLTYEDLNQSSLSGRTAQSDITQSDHHNDNNNSGGDGRTTTQKATFNLKVLSQRSKRRSVNEQYNIFKEVTKIDIDN